jgi:hypothetical protein
MLSELNLALFGENLTCVSSMVYRCAVEVLEIALYVRGGTCRGAGLGRTAVGPWTTVLYSKQRRTDSKDSLSRVSRRILDSAPALSTACPSIVPSQWSRSWLPNRGQRKIRLATAPTRSQSLVNFVLVLGKVYILSMIACAVAATFCLRVGCHVFCPAGRAPR